MTITVKYVYNAIVESVYDGDTIRVSVDLGFNIWKHNESIRLTGIDAPELRGIERPLGLISRDWILKKIPPGTKILLETEKDTQEKYGRYLGTIWLNDVNINKLMIQENQAVPYSE